MIEYSGIPDAEITLLLLNPSNHEDMLFRLVFIGDSGPTVESDKIVQESAPFVRIGRLAALLELLLPICNRFLWYLKQNRARMAKRTPITTPIEIPIANPVDSSFISSSVLPKFLFTCQNLPQLQNGFRFL